MCECMCPCVLAAFVFLSQFYIPALRGECFLWVPLLFLNIYLTFCLSSDYWNDCKLVWNNRLLQSFVSEKNMMTSKWNTILQMVFLLFLYVSAVHSSQLYSWDDNKRRFIKAPSSPLFRDWMPQRPGWLPLSVVILLAADDANLLWDRRMSVEMLDASHADCEWVTKSDMWRPLVAPPKRHIGKEATDVKVTADENEMKAKRGKRKM